MSMSRMYDTFFGCCSCCCCGCCCFDVPKWLVKQMSKHVNAVFEWMYVCQCENTSQDPANHRSKNEISNIVFSLCSLAMPVSLPCTLKCPKVLAPYTHWMDISCSIRIDLSSEIHTRKTSRKLLRIRIHFECYVHSNGNGRCSCGTCINTYKWNLYTLWHKTTKRANRNRDLFADLHFQIHHCSIQMDLTTASQLQPPGMSVCVWAQKHIWLHIKYEFCTFDSIAVIHIALLKKIAPINLSIYLWPRPSLNWM